MSNEEDILLKWFKGELTDSEEMELRKTYDLDALGAVLEGQQKTKIEVKDKSAMWEEFESKQQAPKSPRNRIWLWAGLVLFLASLICLWMVFGNSSQKVQTDQSPEELHFADGTLIDLGPESQLSFDEGAMKENRLFELEGQAYFKVSSGNPFEVETKSGTIRVLGTEFDVWSPSKDLLVVYCYEGSVSVTANNKKVVLKQGDGVTAKYGALGEVSKINNQIPDWKQNIREYKNIPLQMVFQDIARFYDSKFESKGLNLKDEFTGSLPTNNVEDAVNYLEASTGYGYVKEGNTFVFSPN